MQNIKNIILDYGNVLFSIDFTRAQRAFTDLGVPDVTRFYGHLAQDAVFDGLDRGDITAAEFRSRVREVSNRPDLTDQQIDNAWNALLIGVREGHHELLARLHNQYRVFLLSNNNEIHYQWIMDHLKNEHGLEDYKGHFEKDYYSHLMGMRKPDPDIFRYVLDTHGLVPAETLFIDDSPQHIEAAVKIGINAELLTAPDTLPELLARRGLM